MTDATADPTPPPVATFLAWARDASSGDWCRYYEGRLAIDRAQDPGVNRLAETAQLLQLTAYLRLTQMPIPADMEGRRAYIAVRTGRGYAPRVVVQGEITARHYLALRAIRHRPAHLSAVRAIRDDLGLPEMIAERTLDHLRAQGLIERAHGGGWDVAAAISSKIV